MQRPVWGPILKGYMCPFSCRTATCGCMLRHIQQVQAQLQGPLTDTTANTSLFGGHFVVTTRLSAPSSTPLMVLKASKPLGAANMAALRAA